VIDLTDKELSVLIGAVGAALDDMGQPTPLVMRDIEAGRMHTIDLTDEELSVLISAVGAMLNVMAQDVPAGQPTPQVMRDMEALQAKLTALTG